MLSAFWNALRTPDLRRKIFFTLAILAIFRLGSVIPTPNVNMVNVNACRLEATTGNNAGLYSMINLFSGGALLQLAIFALGIMPYITASIILQLLTVVILRLRPQEGGRLRHREDHPVHPLPDPGAGGAERHRVRHPGGERPAVPGLLA